jgi:hypothetical protein
MASAKTIIPKTARFLAGLQLLRGGTTGRLSRIPASYRRKGRSGGTEKYASNHQSLFHGFFSLEVV